MGIVTKKGDRGKTSTLGGEEISKSDLRMDLVGTLDELNTNIGFARSLIKKDGLDFLASELRELQLDLLRLGAELSMGGKQTFENPISQKDVSAIEDKICRLEEEVVLPRSFVLPGVIPCSSAVEIARSVARRLERLIVEAREKRGFENERACIWINRVSDYLFMIARAAEKYSGADFDKA